MEQEGADRGPLVALAPFLADCPAIVTLGLRCALDRYDARERELLRRCSVIFFPTRLYVDLFQAAGKRTFPQATTYRYQRSRLLQYALFRYLAIPTLCTRIYYGRQRQRIPDDFQLPVDLLSDRITGGWRRTVTTASQLREGVAGPGPLLVREGAALRRRLRALVVHDRVVGFQLAESDRPARSWVPLQRRDWPPQPVEQAALLNRSAGLDDIVITWGEDRDGWRCLELRRPPLRWRTPHGVVHRHELICKMVRAGLLY